MGKYKHTKGFEGMQNQAQMLIEQAYKRGYGEGQCDNQTFHDGICESCKEECVRSGYDQGFEDGIKFQKENCENEREELIQQGRNEVWEWCGKYIRPKEDGGEIPVIDLKEIFGIMYFREIFDKYSYSDVVSIVKEYEREKEQEEEIQIGDEVYILDANHPKVVTYTDGKSAVFISQRGCYGVDFIRNLKKTGRHFPEIAEVLKKMGEQNG